MILTVRTDQLTLGLDHQRNCLVAITATATVASSKMTAGSERQNFVGGLYPLRGGGKQAKPVRSNDVGDAVSVTVLLVLAVSWRYERPTLSYVPHVDKNYMTCLSCLFNALIIESGYVQACWYADRAGSLHWCLVLASLRWMACRGLSNLCRDAETDAETVFTPETPRRTPRHFERHRDGRRDKGFCDTISMPN